MTCKTALPFLALAVLAALPATASATLTISYSPETGALVQGDGASEGVSVGDPFGPIRFLPAGFGGTIQTGTLVAGPGCTAGTGASPASPAGSVSCAQSGSGVVTANLGAGDDRIFSSGYPGDQFLFGEDGNDRLGSGDGFDLVDGGAGNDQLGGDSGGTDTLLGKDGNDVLVASQFRAFADRFDGGAGTDVGDYSARTASVSLKVTVGAAGSNDDGAAGEADGLESVETLIGGSANDLLEVRSVLRSSPAGVRTLSGRSGADTLRATGAVTTSLDGGLGQDTVGGGLGVDSIFSREGEFDTITCGGSLDTVRPDLRDTPAADCENLDQSDRREGPNVAFRTRLARVDGDGALSVRLACPRSVRIGCRGVLSTRLDRRGARFGTGERYSLRPGRSATVEVELPAAQTAAARRRGARVRVRSVERGVHGPKTTQRSLRAGRG
jgi:hypothetical protein